MASDPSGLSTPQFACKCLNVRILTSQPPSGPPEYPRDEKYIPVFVKDDGISVTHPEVTVRVASKPEPIAGSPKHSRFLTVTCLFCNLAVYRVHQAILLDIVGNDTTLLPTEEWVEREILKTATGWIDVHKDSLNGENIQKMQSSPSYVSYFSLVLPPPQPLSPLTEEQPTPAPEKESSKEHIPTYLSDLPPLFLPPPFTPSHPIFVHLAKIAVEQSQELRASAEQRILDCVKTETAGIEKKEIELKTQVEALWKTFRQNFSAFQREKTPVSKPARAKDGDKMSTNGLPGSVRPSSSVLIRNFVPEHVSSPLTVSTSLPRVSALSASLATSGFHHPREAQKDQSASTNGQRGHSPDSISSSRTGSSTLVLPASRTAGVSIQEFRRNINDDINTQASYRYFVNLEEDMNRHKRAQEEAKQKEAKEALGDSQRPETSKSRSNSSPDQDPQSKRSQNEGSRSPPGKGPSKSKADTETTPSRGRDKGKRKVTFDVEPAVVSAQSDGESTDKGTADARDMIFPLEDLEGVEKVEDSAEEQPTALPLFEQSTSRPLRPRPARLNPGMEAFASLRPASLPNPSHIRPMRSQPGVDSSSQSMLISRAAVSVRNEPTSSRTTSTSSTPRSEYDAAILKLVAADTPSHRGAWAPESKAWQAFIRGKESKENLPPKISANILEEGVDDEVHPRVMEGDASSNAATRPKAVQFAAKMKVREYDADEEEEEGDEEEDSGDYLKYRGIPGSLPISIAQPVKKEPLTIASYAIRAPISEQPGSIPKGSGGKPLSAAAIHKAAYAERDRVRAMDPGALDFVVQENEEDEEDDEGPGQTDEKNVAEGDKARKHALRILQARSELPEEGMWRSLA